MINIFRTCSTTKYFPASLPSRFPGSSLCTELWGIWGVCSRKGLETMLFFRNLLWMFITFHKQVSVIKTYRPPSTLLLTPPLLLVFPSLPSLNRPFFCFSFPSFYSFLQNPVIYFAYLNSSFVFSCVFTLAIMSIVVVDVAVVLAVAIWERASTKRDIFL